MSKWEGEAPAEPRHGSATELPQRHHPAHGVLASSCSPTIVFLTVCTKDRTRWVADPQVHELLRAVWMDAKAWLVGRYVLMPDHVHLFCAPDDAGSAGASPSQGGARPSLTLWTTSRYKDRLPMTGATLRCPRCQTENRAGRRFCAACGSPFAVACPHCAFENTPGEQFCGGCGQSIVSGAAPAASAPPPAPTQTVTPDVPKDLAAKILAARGRIEGERRQVTVLFCDLANSTQIAERLDPEVYRQLLNEYLERSIGCVYRYEGVINQIAGDGFMAIFGAPIAHDDDAGRACRAALDISAGLSALAADWDARVGQPVAGRIGLNTGLVVVGTVGNDLRMDYTAIGDTTNVAARIQAFATPGQICLSAATRKLVAHSFETEEAGATTFKGKSEPTTVFRLAREIPRRERRHQALRGGLSHFFGRHTELALLNDRYDEARAGRGQVVFIAGEAGMGKSRLIHEFRRSVEAPRYTWLEGQCVSYGAQASYQPFIDLLHGAFDIDESDSPAVQIEKIHAFCTTLGGAVARAEPLYRDLLSVDPGDKRVHTTLETIKSSQYFEAVRDLLLALSAGAPVMLLVEDIHWIDQSSEQLLRRLLDSVAGARVLALVTHRPGYAWPHGDRSYFSRLSLHGLPAALVDELTESVLGRSDLPKAVKRLIVERSDGNPFFAEELAKSLRELGVFERDGANAGLAIEVPSTVQEVIMARIDRLDDDAKHALQVASVIGREFSVRVLERMKDWSASPSETLDKLRSLELIYEKALHPELAYMFKHALTHDVAYGTLLHSQRRDLHRQIGALIEEIYADRLPEFYETLAYQYRQAELVERAARYALLSGERAASHQAPEAEHHFRDAATLARGRADAADIFIGAQAGLGDLLLVQGKIDAANEAYADAIRVSPDDQTTRWLNNKLTHRSFVERDGVRLAYYVQGKADEAATAAPTIPIVLLHPLIQGSYSFNLLALRLCQEYRVIYMDPRGSGASDRPSGPFDFGARVQDAVAILRQLPYPKFVLVGDSDGLRMALHVFHAMPERVDRMVLFGGMVRPRRDAEFPDGFSDGQIEFALQTFVTPDYRTGLANFAAAAFSEPGLSAWRDIMVDGWFTTIPQDHFAQFIRDAMDCDDRALLPGVNVPTLVIGAEGDILVPPIPFVKYVTDHIPGARFALIKGSSHSAPWTAISTFLEMTTTFIKTGTLPRTEWEP